MQGLVLSDEASSPVAMLRQTISFLCCMDYSPLSKAAAKWEDTHPRFHAVLRFLLFYVST
ncbi:hypothetical protein E2562_012015 [Oryza meyeriana var. granulata]|uniref:Uncharacterized protein n=1 Tax=Oryza meyeriana var. granulata TaxID=110450 RepID=A0A6G1D2F7_9ORYZ|nr:hypothetical protein E2562_012015 [Oryza meyeriana var. granulata]